MNVLLNIPAHTNCTNCGECCGMIPATKAEIKQIRDYLRKHEDVRELAIRQSHRALSCPFRDEQKRKCAIYPVRPLICRLMGVSAGMKCVNGNSAEIDGYSYLREHSLDKVSLLNHEDWAR